MNCPNCGAVVKEGKFCNYCGAKLPDDTKRVEVNINKRIEDVAEMKRADYENEESKLRQKQEARKYRANTAKRITCLVVFAICAIVVLIGILGGSKAIDPVAMLFAIFVGAFMLIYTVLLLITGKW